MNTENKPHPFIGLSELIDKYRDNKNTFDLKELQTLREDISLCLFYLSDSCSVAISNYDYAEHNRKSKAAERLQKRSRGLQRVEQAKRKSKNNTECNATNIKCDKL